jgi:hypothetical protein
MNSEESRVMAAVVDALKAMVSDFAPHLEGGEECELIEQANAALAQYAALQREGEPAVPMMLAPVSMLREYQDMLASCDGNTEAIDALFGESSDEEE